MGNRALIDKLRHDIQAIESGEAQAPEFDSALKRRNGESPNAERPGLVNPRYPSDDDGHQAQVEPGEGDDREQKSALSRIVAWANVRDRSLSAVRARLKKEGYDESSIEDAVTRALDYGILDDSRYADVLIRSRLAQGKGAAGIERELEGEGISPFEVEGWPYSYGVDDESEFQRALDVLEKNPSRSKNKRDGAYRKLIGKGYSSSVASSAARVWADRSS